MHVVLLRDTVQSVMHSCGYNYSYMYNTANSNRAATLHANSNRAAGLACKFATCRLVTTAINLTAPEGLAPMVFITCVFIGQRGMHGCS